MDEERVSAKAWRCHNRHVMGIVVERGGGKRLMVYRQAVDQEAEEPAQVDVMAVVEGSAFDIRCSVCGEMRAWVPDRRVIEKMLRTMERI